MTPEALLTLLAVAIVINVAIMVVLVIALVRRRREPAPAVSTSYGPSAAAAIETPVVESIEPMSAMGSADPEDEDAESEPADDVDADEDGLLSILTDPATGLDNRLAWDRAVYQENERKRRYGRPVSVVIAELSYQFLEMPIRETGNNRRCARTSGTWMN